jgi:hypothetical protein
MLKNFFETAIPVTIVFGILVGYFAIVAAFWGGMI